MRKEDLGASWRLLERNHAEWYKQRIHTCFRKLDKPCAAEVRERQSEADGVMEQWQTQPRDGRPLQTCSCGVIRFQLIHK